MDKETIGKLIFIVATIIFLLSMVLIPKTDCDACKISWEGKHINGYKAWEIYQEACINYRKPWDPIYINIDDINTSKDIPQVNISQQSIFRD